MDLRSAAGHWNDQGGPFKDALNNSPKYVVSNTLGEPLPWPIPRCCAAMSLTPSGHSRRNRGVLAIMGSGELIASLIAADLIDEYLLMVHPLVLGPGRRLFPEKVSVPLRLTDCVTTPSGLLIATYEPERD